MALIINNVYTTASTTENLSRNDMLAWVNECLQSEFVKIEQLHTGAGYLLFNRKLQVKWNSRLELDWLNNWKLTQTVWQQIGVDKVVPVEKLVKGKFQDNFEFLQWFKKFFDANYDGHEYNPMELRGYEELPGEPNPKAKSGAAAVASSKPVGQSRMPQQQKSGVGTLHKQAPPTSTHQSQRYGSNASVNSSGAASTIKKSAPAQSRPTAAPMPSTVASTTAASKQLKGPSSNPAAATQQRSGVDVQVFEEVKRELEEARQQLAESDDVVAGLEKERDFYFKKLRAVELLCQENEGAGALDIARILEILYETEEGFAPPEEAESGVNGSAQEY